MKKFSLLFVFMVCLTLSYHRSEAQSVDQLRKERKEIQDRINATNKLLQKTRKDEKNAMKNLNTLRKNLNDRRKLIHSYTAEIRALDKKIGQLDAEKNELQRQLKKIKSEYTQLIRNTQMNRNNYSKLMFLLSAKDFDQTLRRARYLREFSDYKKAQTHQINLIKRQVEQKTDSLDVNKADKMKALKTKEMESAKLRKKEREEKTWLAALKQKEKTLSDEYKAHQRKKTQIDNKIQQVIAEEIRKAEAKKREKEAQRKKAQAASRKGKTNADEKQSAAGQTHTASASKASESVSMLTREEQIIMGGFSKNRGRLPWPVDRGVISGRFGKHPHPQLKHVTINNKGTYFQSPAGTNARAVYEGVVTRRFALPGSGSAVIVQHGSYRTVYGNLSTVYVHEGEKVTAKQPIGKIFTDTETGHAVLQFQLWSGSALLNPEAWIVR